jgi:membrane fusion protein (multidrug efflux system)
MAQDSQPASQGEVPAAKRGKRWLPLISFIVITAIVAWFGWRWYDGQRGFVSTDDAYVDADRLAVSSKMLGRIERLGADEGDTVRVDQFLVQLDVSDLRAQQAQANASLILAQQNVRLAQVSLNRTKADLERARLQFQSNTITAEQLEHAQSDFETAGARLAIAQAQIGSSKAQTGVIDTSLHNATIVSPMNGVISKRWTLPGDVVQPGQPIYSIYNLDSVWVTANLEETKLGRIHIGDSVSIHVDAYPDHDLTGSIRQMGTNTASQFSLIPPNNASGNFTKVTQRVPVKISIHPHNRNISLLPGMSVVVKVKV